MSKIYQVFLTDVWNNNYLCGFFNSLEDPQLISSINSFIQNEQFKVQAGDIKEYASTLESCFDTTVYDIIEARLGDDIDDCDEELQIQIRGFIFDKDSLKEEVNKL